MSERGFPFVQDRKEGQRFGVVGVSEQALLHAQSLKFGQGSHLLWAFGEAEAFSGLRLRDGISSGVREDHGVNDVNHAVVEYMTDAHHPIQLAARLTGLSTHVIRIWEQRYHAVEPKRAPTNHRLYSQSDLERLSLLRDVTRAGHNIGQMARLSTDQLRALAANASGPKPHAPRPATVVPVPDDLLEECLASVQTLDAGALDDTLMRATTALGAQGVLLRLVAPLTQTLGDLWREGKITAAHEHFGTGHTRVFLANLAEPFGGSEGAPALVVATPAGHDGRIRHEAAA